MMLHFLHGFLGFPSDWDVFNKDFLPNKFLSYTIDDFLSISTKHQNDFVAWAQNFNKTVFSAKDFHKNKNILVGYSLGGRLALHSLLEDNAQWDGAIIVSANPGLSTEIEKEQRIKNDEAWASRFLNEPWESLMQAWNSQGVFSGENNNFNREEKLYNRIKLAEVITKFSLGRQEDLRSAIKNIRIPILWVCGELDTKFSLIGKEMPIVSENIKSVIVPNVGHRVPWEAHGKFKELCLDFCLK